MSSPIDGTDRDPFVYDATVIDTADPLNLHRVRATIEGKGPTVWAYPKTIGGGGPQRGGHLLPKVGQTVLIQFLHGDLKRPIYEGAWWGTGEAPRDVLAAGSDAPLVQSFEVAMGGGASLRITLDEREATRAWKVAAVSRADDGTETVIAAVELDLRQRVLDLYGLAGVQVRSLGFVDVKALVARITKRRVDRSTKPI